ncbi:Csl4p [Sugiyamaella lignohabitans]|uniref:Csl4p n=1 Tax=Sugiyamaella lignohabitans TaxID=796027 RepID=A0A167F9Q0_9ASCO|nr:Csl4p [Sugiyamaella lignohabitans]ANB15001.1 Csl4p [Sugiyamaella lignohabitans]
MTLPGYVVPGQIISPLIEKEGNVVRRYKPGHGVVERDFGNVKALSATLVGKIQIVSLDGKKEDDIVMVDDEDLENDKKSKVKGKPTELVFQINIENKFNYGSSDNVSSTRVGTSVLPEVGDIVYAKVVKLTLVQTHVEILVVENQGTISAESGLGVHASADGVVGLPPLASGQGSASSSGDIAEGFGGIIRIQDVRATQRDKVKIQESFKPGDIVRALVLSLGDGNNYYLSTARNDLGVIFAKSAAGEHMYPIDWQTMKSSVTGALELRKCAKPF